MARQISARVLQKRVYELVFPTTTTSYNDIFREYLDSSVNLADRLQRPGSKTGPARLDRGTGETINRMRRIITTYLAVVLVLSLGFFGVGALASAQQSATADRTPVSMPADAGESASGS
jgi:hypothetical protein